MKTPLGEYIWLDCKYERLPTFCFICGRICHVDKFCLRQFEDQEAQPVKEFDSKLRASNRRIQIQSSQWLLAKPPKRMRLVARTLAVDQFNGEDEVRETRYEVPIGERDESIVLYLEVNMQPVDAQGQIGASIQCMHNNINDAIEALSADLVNQYDVMGFLITE